MQSLYRPGNNSIVDFHEFEEGLISQIEQINELQYFIKIENKIFLYNTGNQQTISLIEFTEDVVSFKHESINGQLFIGFKNKIDIYSYPGLELSATLPVASPLKSIEVKYSF